MPEMNAYNLTTGEDLEVEMVKTSEVEVGC